MWGISYGQPSNVDHVGAGAFLQGGQGSEQQTAHLVVAVRPLLSTHSEHQRLRRTAHRVQLWRLGVDIALPSSPPSAEALPSSGR